MSASALCSLTCAKLMQTESRDIKFYLRDYAEVQLNFCKVNKKKVQCTTPHSFALKHGHFNV